MLILGRRLDAAGRMIVGRYKGWLAGEDHTSNHGRRINVRRVDSTGREHVVGDDAVDGVGLFVADTGNHQ